MADGRCSTCPRAGKLRRGWCNKCYKRWRRYGDPLGGPPLPPDLPGERWLPVVGWEDLYAVSNLARLRSFHTHGRGLQGGLLKPVAGTGGYLAVQLSRNGVSETRRLAHLVLEAFAGERPAGEEACHGPGGPGDDRLVNLTWGTKAKNCGPDKLRDGTLLRGETQPNAKLTEAMVAEIRRRYAGGERQAALAREFGVSQAAVSVAARGVRWAHLPDGIAQIPLHGGSGETHMHAKLTWESVAEIRRRYAAGETQSVLAREFGVRQSTLQQVTSGKTWRAAS